MDPAASLRSMVARMVGPRGRAVLSLAGVLAVGGATMGAALGMFGPAVTAEPVACEECTTVLVENAGTLTFSVEDGRVLFVASQLADGWSGTAGDTTDGSVVVTLTNGIETVIVTAGLDGAGNLVTAATHPDGAPVGLTDGSGEPPGGGAGDAAGAAAGTVPAASPAQAASAPVSAAAPVGGLDERAGAATPATQDPSAPAAAPGTPGPRPPGSPAGGGGSTRSSTTAPRAASPGPTTTAAPGPGPATGSPSTTSTTTIPPWAELPRDWPAGKPYPPMPANCREPHLEDNGVWNCG